MKSKLAASLRARLITIGVAGTLLFGGVALAHHDVCAWGKGEDVKCSPSPSPSVSPSESPAVSPEATPSPEVTPSPSVSPSPSPSPATSLPDVGGSGRLSK